MITPTGQPYNSPLYISPAQIFTGAVDGVWYDPSDLSTLFQDDAGTIPVTADGDPVGLMLDKSGNGFHASQATAGNRPVYKTDGVTHWLQLTSANSQFMTHAANAPGTGNFLGVYTFETASTGGIPFLAFGSGINTSYSGTSFGNSSTNGIQIRGADATASGALISNSVSAAKQIVSATRNTLFRDGVSQTLNLNTLGSLNLTNTNKRLFCFYTFTNQSFFNGKFFGGVYVVGDTTTQQRQIAQYYLAKKARVASA